MSEYSFKNHNDNLSFTKSQICEETATNGLCAVRLTNWQLTLWWNPVQMSISEYILMSGIHFWTWLLEGPNDTNYTNCYNRHTHLADRCRWVPLFPNVDNPNSRTIRRPLSSHFCLNNASLPLNPIKKVFLVLVFRINREAPVSGTWTSMRSTG